MPCTETLAVTKHFNPYPTGAAQQIRDQGIFNILHGLRKLSHRGLQALSAREGGAEPGVAVLA